MLGACAEPAPPSDHPAEPTPSPTALICRIDPAAIVRTIPRGLFGTNLEWFNNANGIAGPDGSVDDGWIRLARDQGIDHVRFPGGTLSDFYNWRDGIGPVSRRPLRDHPTDEGRSANVMGTPEFLRFCKAVGANPLITVNVGTAEAAEAASWVAYCNQPDHPERKADGLAAPANVKLWEVGNEVYLPGNPGDKKKITVTPEVYAERYLRFAAAMRKADPSIKLMGIGTANAYALPLPYPNWSEVVLEKAAGEMDYYAVHNAYFPMIFGQKNLSLKDVYQSLWASPEAVDRSLTKLDALIAKHEKGRRVEIAVTEWGALFSFDRDWIDHVKTMGSSVYLARLMQVYMTQPRVSLASYFKFTDHSFMGWVGYDQKPKIPYHVIELFARHFGSRLVKASIESPTFDVKQLGVMSAESNVPELTVVASLDDSGRKLFVNIINRSWQTVHQVKLETAGFVAADTATSWSLSSPGLTDHNGRDLPPGISEKLFREPAQHAAAKPRIGLERKTLDLKTPVTLPPYSIVTLELDARP